MMPVIYKFDTNGGFTVGDTMTGLTSYAYPSSLNAKAAKHSPELTAHRMVRNIRAIGWLDPEYNARNWKRLHAPDH